MAKRKVKKRATRRRAVATVKAPVKAPMKEWWEEDWAVPVLGVFAVATFFVLQEMYKEGQLKKEALARAKVAGGTV